MASNYINSQSNTTSSDPEAKARGDFGDYLQNPESVQEQGSVSGETVGTIRATSLVVGGLQTQIRIGKNGTIIINDGTNDRIIIGYQKGGF